MAIEILTNKGRFQIAVGHQKDIAQIYKSNIVDLEKAMQLMKLQQIGMLKKRQIFL